MSESRSGRVLFVYPPFHDPDMPYLALPLLAATVESEMSWISCEIDDLNRRWYDRFLGDRRLQVGGDLHEDVTTILNTFDRWDDALAGAFQAPGYRVSYRKVRVPFNWANSTDLVQEMTNPNSPLRHDLSRLIVDDARYQQADAIGISVGVEDQVPAAVAVAATIRDAWPEKPIIWGGNIVTRCHAAFESDPLRRLADRVVEGEGDSHIVDVLTGLVPRPADAPMPRVLSLGSQTSVYEQPTVDWSHHVEPNMYFAPMPVIPVLGSRRCYWGRCEFCGIYIGWNNGIRHRSVDAIVEEISRTAAQGHRYFRFVDEDLPPRLMQRLADKFIRLGLPIRWEAYSRFEPLFLKPGVAEKLYESGCRQIFFGLENIGEQTAAIVDKGSFYTRGNIERVLARTATAGILNYLFVLVGIPTTPLAEEEATTEFLAINHDVDAAAIGSFVVDRLSPIHVNEGLHGKYGVELYEIGDLTTEIGFHPSRPEHAKESGQERAERYTGEVFRARPDLALNSLLTEEQRLYLADRHSRDFARNFVSSTTPSMVEQIVAAGLSRSVAEKVARELAS